MKASKAQLLAELVTKRRLARWDGYGNLAEYGYDCEFVSPYTKSAGNVDAEVFVMLQDWTSADGNQNGPDPTILKLGFTPTLPTNIRLDRLLKDLLGLSRSETYATNLFPFIKPGGINAMIPRGDLLRAAMEFGWPQIAAIGPKLVIALGLETFNALRKAAGHARIQRLKTAINTPFDQNGTRIWCQGHTGSLGTRNAGGDAAVKDNWKTKADWFIQDAQLNG